MKQKYLLLLLFAFAFLIRVIYLGNNPTILNRDEAALGYNALLLEQTGKDEWGKQWQLTLESFGDYKLIGYPALLVGLFHFFTPTDFLVRLPSALAGAGIVIIIYFLFNRFSKDTQVGLCVSFLTAITPVFFFYSRIAFEANVALFFFLFSLVFWFRPVDEKSFRFDVFGLLFMLIAVVTYNTPLLLLPFILLLLPFWRGLKNVKNWLFLCGAGALLFILFFSIFSSLTAQKQGITIFADETTNIEYGQYRQQFTGISQKLIGNKYSYYASIMVNHFASSFAPYFLVIHGGTHPWHQLPGWGHFFWSEYIAIVLGIVIALKTILVKRKEWLTVMTLRDGLENNSVGKKLSVFFLLLISLAPSVITVDAPHATRSLFFFVILMVFIGFCLEFFTETYKKIAISLVVLTSSYFFIAYLFSYFTQFPATQKIILWSGFDKTIQEVQSKYPKEKIAVVDPSGYQYILLAWYAHISPQQFFATVSKQLPDRIGFRYGEQVGRYHFIARSEDRSQTEKIVVEWKEGSWQIRDN